MDNEESDESYESSWSYVQHIQSNAMVGHDRATFHKEVTDNKVTTQLYLLQNVLAYSLSYPNCHSLVSLTLSSS